jgi:hypothetical protein
MKRLIVVWAFVAASAGFARTAAAFPTTRLVYGRGPGAEQCPGAEVIREAVKLRLGYDPFFSNADKTIVARITRDGDRLRGQVLLVDERGLELGLREFNEEIGRCQSLIQALALSISIAVDPNSAQTYSSGPPDEASAEPEARQSEDEADLHSAQKPAALPHAEASARRSRPPPAPRSIRWSLGLTTVGVFASLPETTFGGQLGASGRIGAFAVSLEGQANAPITHSFEPGVTLSAWSASLHALPCLHWGPGFGCAIASIERTQMKRNGDPDIRESRLSFQAGGRLGVGLALSELIELIGQGDVLVSAAPVRVTSEGRELWHADTVVAQVGVGVAMHFW